jgi:hypothetical protein
MRTRTIARTIIEIITAQQWRKLALKS